MHPNACSEEIIDGAPTEKEDKPPEEKSPVREVVFAIRAIGPLIATLILIIKVLLRIPFPHLSVYTVPASANTRVDGRDGEDPQPSHDDHHLATTSMPNAATPETPTSQAGAPKVHKASRLSTCSMPLPAHPDPSTQTSAAGEVVLEISGEQPASQAGHHGDRAIALTARTGSAPAEEAMQVAVGAPRPEGHVPGLAALQAEAKPHLHAISGNSLPATQARSSMPLSEPDTLASFGDPCAYKQHKQGSDGLQGQDSMPSSTMAATDGGSIWDWPHWPFVVGVIFCQGGMIMFNLVRGVGGCCSLAGWVACEGVQGLRAGAGRLMAAAACFARHACSRAVCVNVCMRAGPDLRLHHAGRPGGHHIPGGVPGGGGRGPLALLRLHRGHLPGATAWASARSPSARLHACTF